MRSRIGSRRRCDFLLDPANQQRRSALFQGRERHYYEINWNGRRIWGATAAMIVNLSRRLQWQLILDAAKWRRKRGMKRLLAALGADEGLTRYVGGAVRDDLLGLPVNDIDLATRHCARRGDRAAGEGADQGGSDRHRAWHDHRRQRRPSVRDHDLANATSRPTAGARRSPSPTTGRRMRRGAISPSTRFSPIR